MCSVHSAHCTHCGRKFKQTLCTHSTTYTSFIYSIPFDIIYLISYHFTWNCSFDHRFHYFFFVRLFVRVLPISNNNANKTNSMLDFGAKWDIIIIAIILSIRWQFRFDRLASSSSLKVLSGSIVSRTYEYLHFIVKFARMSNWHCTQRRKKKY